jgi:hypothetical protein
VNTSDAGPVSYIRVSGGKPESEVNDLHLGLHLTFRIDAIVQSDYLSLMAAGFYNSANCIGLPKIFRKNAPACFNAKEAP